MSKATVLFVCQHNAGRSQLGAALLELLAGDGYIARSAGVSPAQAVNPAVAATVAELGLDISTRVPRAVTIADIESADIVVTMKPGLALPAAPTGRYIEWSFPDPTAWDVKSVRPLRKAVASRIEAEILSAD